MVRQYRGAVTNPSDPAWAGTDPETANERVFLKKALDGLLSQLGELTRPVTITDADLLLLQFRFPFSHTTIRAIETLAKDLVIILFGAPLKGDAGDVYLVMFLDTKLLRQLRVFTDDLLNRDAPRPAENDAIDRLETWMHAAAESASRAIQESESAQDRAAIHKWIQALEVARQDFERSLNAQVAAEMAMQAADEAISARDLARQAAGETGAVSLGAHFKEISVEESRTAFWWTVTAVSSLVLVIGAGILIIFRSAYTQWIETLLHLAIVLPIIGLATFSARLARYHRLLGRWAKTASVQINSIGAFAEQISNDQAREELILYLGRTVFGPPIFADDSKTETVSAVPPELVDLLREFVRKQGIANP